MVGISHIKISSMAAPTEEDMAVIRSLTTEQWNALVAAELAKGEADIEAGRVIEISSEKDIADFMKSIRARHEAAAE